MNNLRSSFSSLKNKNDIADLLEINISELNSILEEKDNRKLYRVFLISKRNGKFRKIYSPIGDLKRTQRTLANVLNSFYVPNESIYGFVKNKNHIDNAKYHYGAKYILNIDMKDFFPNIWYNQVVKSFTKEPFNCSEKIAEILAQITCYDRSFLPQGAPSSPIISNIVFSELDSEIEKYLRIFNNNVKYSRYADDLTFSSPNKYDLNNLFIRRKDKIYLSSELLQIIREHKCLINYNKLKARSINSRLEVTGLVINKSINIKREYTSNLRAILFKCSKDGLYSTALEYIQKDCTKNPKIIKLSKDESNKEKIEEWFKSVLISKINYIGQVKGYDNHTFYSFASKINNILNKNIYNLPTLER